MNKLYDKYPVSQRRVKPRLHPVVQLAVNEYNVAHREQRDFNWSVLTVDTVAPLCQQQAAQNPKWAPRHQLPLPRQLLWGDWSQQALVELPSGTGPSGGRWCAYHFNIPMCVMLTVHSQHGRSRDISTSCTGTPFALHILSRSLTSSSKG